MFQISVIGALLLKRPHCMAMHETLKLPKDSSGNGYPMPATFDLLMDDSPTARGSQLWRDMKDGPRVHGLRVELGWAAFVRRANKEVEHHADQRRLARESARREHEESLYQVAERRRQHAAEATEACMRAMQARVIETKQPLPDTKGAAPGGLLQTTQLLSQDDEAAITQMKLNLEAAAKALGQVLTDNTHLKQPCKQGQWWMDRAKDCTCECDACLSVRAMIPWRR